MNLGLDDGTEVSTPVSWPYLCSRLQGRSGTLSQPGGFPVHPTSHSGPGCLITLREFPMLQHQACVTAYTPISPKRPLLICNNCMLIVEQWWNKWRKRPNIIKDNENTHFVYIYQMSRSNLFWILLYTDRWILAILFLCSMDVLNTSKHLWL